MKAEQEDKNGAEAEKDINKKIDIAFKAVIIGLAAIFLLQEPDIIYRIPYEAVVAVISGVALTLCISVAVFSFVKPNAWLYRAIAAAVSLFAGVVGFLNLYNDTFDMDEYGGAIYVSDFLFNLLGDTRLFVPFYIGACTVYAGVIFGFALLVQYIYKKRKNKKASTP